MHVRLPEHGVINLKNTSFRITGAVETAQASTGVIACQGGNMAGWSLYLDNESRPPMCITGLVMNSRPRRQTAGSGRAPDLCRLCP